jgi:hypothetical protein
MHMLKATDIIAAINLDSASKNLSSEALDAHAPGIIAQNAPIDGNEEDILKIHGAKAIPHAEDVIIIGRRPGGAGGGVILADGNITHD